MANPSPAISKDTSAERTRSGSVLLRASVWPAAIALLQLTVTVLASLAERRGAGAWSSWVPLASAALLLPFAASRTWTLARSGGRPWAALAAAAFVLLAGLSARKVQYRLEGDEPWYMVIAASVAEDHDLRTPPEEVEARSSWIFGAPLGTSQLAQYRGRWRVTHWPAYAAVLVPSARWHWRLLSQLLQSMLVAAALALAGRAWARLSGSTPLATLIAALLFACGPLAQFSLLFFPDALAAALWLFALAGALDGTLLGLVAAGLALGGAVWLRSALVLLAPAAMVFAPRDRRAWPMLASFAVSLAGFLAFHLRMYGTPNPLPTHTVDLAGALPSLARSLFEPGRGLALNYPLLLLALVAAVVVCRSPPSLAALLCVAAYLVPCCLYRESSGVGGWTPAARFWVPLAPLLATALVVEAERLKGLLANRAVKLVLLAAAALGAATNLVCTLAPQYAFNDGAWWLSRLFG